MLKRMCASVMDKVLEGAIKDFKVAFLFEQSVLQWQPSLVQCRNAMCLL
jgi:hypothetical protein